MDACFSCHSLCENPKIYRVYHGAKSLKIYATGNYTEYNKKSISEQVVSDEVHICANCIEKAGNVNRYNYAVKLWSAGANHTAGQKCCYRCYHISESRFCSYYKYALPLWIKYFIDIEKIEPTIDLGPVKYMVYCNCWKSINSTDENSLDSFKNQFRFGIYLIKYHKQIRNKIKKILFQDLFSFNNIVDDIQLFLSSNSSGSILDRSYSYLFYKPYRNILGSNFYKKYYDTRSKLKDWAGALS